MSRRQASRVVITVAVVVLAASRFWAQDSKPAQATIGLQNPPPVRFADLLPDGAMQAKAMTACTECHEARIILQQRLSKGAWTKEVDKMMKWGAVVDASDRDALIDYLSTNFSPDEPPYQAPRISSHESAANGGARKKAK